MLTVIPNVLNAAQLQALQSWLDQATWTDGRSTAGSSAARVKHNHQVSEQAGGLGENREIVTKALAASGLFQSAVLPQFQTPPMFARYAEGMGYGEHLDNALMLNGGLRADVAYTLFLSPPESYDGGELVISSNLAPTTVKLAAGSVVTYPASTLHRVNPVTRGVRRVAVGWVQSRVREAERREVLLDLARAAARMQSLEPHGEGTKCLEKSRLNLLRMWA